MFALRLKAACTFVVVLLLCSCSQSPKPAASSGDSEKAAASGGPVSGKTAFWEMYKSAHAWAADLTPLSLESKTLSGVKNDSGKAALWIATFGSPRKHEARTFTYAVVAHSPDVLKGVTVGHAITWAGPTRNALPFSTSDFSIDSDAAYQTALAQSADWVKKHPDKECSLALGNASRFDGPVWYVLWGDSKSGHSVYVSAKTGTVVK